jgi:protein-tyrosine phosphatase
MIDLHSHPLPGLDDGAPDLTAGVALVRAAQQAGVTVIAATPHVRDDFPTTAAQMTNGVAALARAVGGDAGIAVTTGAEVAAVYLQRLDDDEIIGLTLGSSGRYLLVELPYSGWSIGIELAFQRLTALGIQPLIAHPERNNLVQERPARLESLVEAGARVQVTARATRSRYDRPSAVTAAALVRLGLVHVVASDAHAAPKTADYSPWEVGLADDLVERLCLVNPTAILQGEDVPHRARTSGSLLRRLRPFRRA